MISGAPSGVLTLSVDRRDEPVRRSLLSADFADHCERQLVLTTDVTGMWGEGWSHIGQSIPLPAQSYGFSPFGPYWAGWGWGERNVPICAAWEVVCTSRSVRRAWYADLVAGRYQLPPCESVQVGLVVWSARDIGPLGTMVVQGQVEAASASAYVRPWTYSEVTGAVVETVPTAVKARVPVPEGGYAYQPYFVAPTPALNPAQLSVSTYTGRAQDWTRVPPVVPTFDVDGPQVEVRWDVLAGAPVGVEYFAGYSFELRP